jgi:site-specific recombinase XerD
VVKIMDEVEFRKFLKDGGMSENTVKAYISHMNKFEWYLRARGNELEEANRGDIKDFARWGVREFKRTCTINSYLYGIQKYYEFKEKDKMVETIKKLPRYKRPKSKARLDLLNWDDFQKFMKGVEKNGISNRDRALLNLLWSRMSAKEILQLKISNLNFEECHIILRSGTRYVSERAWVALEQYVPIEERGKKKRLFRIGARAMSMRTFHHITQRYFGKIGQTAFKLRLGFEKEIMEEGEKRAYDMFRVIQEKTHKSEADISVPKKKKERLFIPTEVLENIPQEVRKTIKGIISNYQNNFPDFCFWGMRKALIDAINIRFRRNGKDGKLYNENGNAYNLPKWIELAKQERYISANQANKLNKEVKVFGDTASHDHMTDLQKEEVPTIFKHLRLALARMYYQQN